MSAKIFLDTNVLVYAFDRAAEAKRELARSILLSQQDWVVSWQVVQEFSNVALHRFKKPMVTENLGDYLELVLMPHCLVMPTKDIYLNAIRIQSQTNYRFYDSLIVASALVSGAKQLYSEDMQAGRRIGDLEIVNPFA
jgi:predicted nucleic acid-binding protein